MEDVAGGYQEATVGGMTVSSNTETSEAITENLESDAKPLDGESPDPEKEEADAVAKAAAKLGEKGGKAAAERRAADKRNYDKAMADAEERASEARAKEAKAEDSKKDKKGDPRHDPKARVEEATRESAELKRELRRERDERARERAEFNARLEKIEKSGNGAEHAAAPARHADEKPLEKDFEDYGEFVEARSRWAARQEYAEVERKRTIHQQAASFANSVQQTFDKFRESALKESIHERVAPELLDLVPTAMLEPNARPDQGNVIADEIVSSEQSNALLLHFTEHPEDFQRIASLRTPRDISREIAKIEARLESAQSSASPQRHVASQAKPPVRPVSGSPNASDPDAVDDDMSFEEHARRMNARDQRMRRTAHGR